MTAETHQNVLEAAVDRCISNILFRMRHSAIAFCKGFSLERRIMRSSTSKSPNGT